MEGINSLNVTTVVNFSHNHQVPALAGAAPRRGSIKRNIIYYQMRTIAMRTRFTSPNVMIPSNQTVDDCARTQPEQNRQNLRWWFYSFMLLFLLVQANKTWADGFPTDVVNTYISSGNGETVMYVYANAGERIVYNFTKTNGATAGAPTWTVRLYSPAALVSTCSTLTGASAAGTQCASGAAGYVAPISGIYTFRLSLSAVAEINQLQWDIVVKNSANTATLPGRVYQEIIKLSQPTSNFTTPPNITLYAVSEFGYKYTVAFQGYHGAQSTIVLDKFGVRSSSSCTSLYRSRQYGDVTSLPPAGFPGPSAAYDNTSGTITNYAACGDAYKIFYKQIDNSIPATAPIFNFNTNSQETEWLNPAAVNPSIGTLTFNKSASGNPLNGIFTFNVTDYAGNATFQVDANGDGDYVDAVDVSQPISVTTGSNTVSFTGTDGTGNSINCASGALKARILIDKAGEIHLTLADVEQLQGGLQLTRTTGPGAPNSVVYWDDRALVNTGKCSITPVKDGRAGVNSAVTPVHNWVRCAAGAAGDTWGNTRFIDNWAFAATNITSEVSLVQVSGRVFNDVNYNGSDESNADAGISGAYLVLQNSAGQCIATTQTAADGSYCFPGIVANSGAYTISETVANPGSTCPPVTFTQPNGFQISTTVRTRTVTVAAVNITDQDFGHAPCTATASSNAPVCAGQTVTLSGSGTGTVYTWTGPNGFSSTSQTPSIPNATTANSGSYTLTVTGNTGCTAVSTTNVLVTEQAGAASSSPVCEGQTLFLNATGDNTATYLWSGPNGFSSTSKAPTIVGASLSAAGTYTVVVTSSAGCSGTGTTQVVINAKPTVTITGNRTVCNGQTTTLTATGTGFTAFQWNNGANTASITITPGVSLSYVVTVMNAAGCSQTAAAPVTVNTCQEICDDGIDNDGDGLTDSDDPDCLCNTDATGTRVYTVAPVPGATSYNWQITKQGGGDFTSAILSGAGTNSIVVDLAALNAGGGIGSYDICVVCNSTTCGTTPPSCKVITIRPCCDLGVNAVIASTSICVGNPIDIVASAVGAQNAANVTYAWTGPNGFVATTATISIPNATTANAGSYTVIATEVTGAQSCTAINVVEITVETPGESGENKTISLCNNETVDLATLFPAGGSFTALSGSMTGTVFSGIDSGVGSYTVVFSGAGTTSCPGGESNIIIVVRDCTPPPCNYPISAGKIDASCGNSDGTADVTMGGLPTGATVAFAWSNGKTGPKITGLAAGVYSVTATITTANGACTVIDSVNINDIGAPVGDINLITSADCQGANGAVAIDITPGSPTDLGPFRIVWTGAASGSKNDATAGTTTIANLAPGSYVFEISSTTSNTACSSFLAITIPRDDSDRIAVTGTPTNATACDSFTGSIVITATPAVGVTGPFSYSLNGVEVGVSALTSFTVTGLGAGVYMVGVSSASGCTSAEKPVTIQETGAPAIAGWTVVNPTCPTDKGQLVFAGGQPTATFVVREVTTGAILSPVGGITGASSTSLTLPAGTYSIEGTSTASTCSSFTTVTIVVPEGINFNVQYTKVNCGPGGTADNDGTITIVQIRGGTEPYSTTVTNAQNQVIASASPGVYNNLAPGIYSVRVVDANGCSGIESIFVTVPNCEQVCPVIPITTFVVDANCGAADGRAVAQLGAYDENDVDYQWSNNFSGKNTNGLMAGVYSVTATVLTGTYVGCPYVRTINVNDIGGPEFEKRVINASTCTGATGSVSFSVVSGTGPYVVSWTGPSSGSANIGNTGSGFTFNRTGLAAGDYVFTLTGSTSNCKSTQDVTIPVSSSSAITLAATPAGTSSCGAQDGSINLTASGSGPNYTFSLNGTVYTSVSVNTVSISNLPAGVYTVGVTSGANGCETERQVLIPETGAPVVTGWTSQSATCPTTEGSLIFAGGQSADVTYRVLLGAGGTVIGTTPGNVAATINAPKGVYVIERKETVGGNVCTSFQSFTINVPDGIDFNVQYTPETCGPGGTGNGDGTLKVVQINGGTPGYTVTVTDLTTGIAATNLLSLGGGDYKVSVTDANGCPGNEDALVTVPPCQIKCPALTFETTVIDNKCGEINGQATANLLGVPAGSTATYLWSNGANGPVATGLSAGVYSVTALVTSADGAYNACTYVKTVNVNDIGGPLLSLQLATAASCTAANGSAVLNLTGTGPFQLSWTGPTSGNQSPATAAPVTITGLKAGNYVFTLTGNGTCKSVLDVTIPNNSTNVINATAVPGTVSSCGANDGRIVITVTGGVGPFTYSINGYIEGVSNVRTFTRTGLPAGTYTVTVTDANGCSVAKTNVIINPVGQPAIAGWTKTDPLCPDESGTLVYANPGTDAGATYVVSIANTATILGQATAGTPFSLTVPGGSYLITRTTSTSCVSVTTITVNQPTGMDFNIQYIDPTCALPTGGSLTVVQPSGGTGSTYSYTITGASGVVATSATASNLAPGSYTVTMADTRGCTLSDVVTLTGGASLTATATPTIVCVGGSLDLTVDVTPAGSYTFAWSGPAGFVSAEQNPTIPVITTAGDYTVVVTDAAGCASTATVAVSVTACCDLVATAVPTSVTSCLTPNSGSIAITYTGSGTYQYSVNGGASQSLGASPFTVSNLAAGNYTIVIQAVGDPTCSQSLTTVISAPVSPTVTAQSNSPLCTGNTLTLLAGLSGGSAGATYSWTGPNGFSSTEQNPTIPNTTSATAGTYQVTVTNAGGCTSSASTTVTIANSPSLTVTSGTSLTICSGQSTTLAVGGDNGANVTWINDMGQSGTGTTINFAGLTNVSGVPRTISYKITAQAGSCSDVEIVTITINPAPALQVTPIRSVICSIETTNLTATAFPAGATVTWTRDVPTPAPASGSNVGSVTVTDTLPAGTYNYTFTATDTNGCSSPAVVVPVIVND